MVLAPSPIDGDAPRPPADSIGTTEVDVHNLPNSSPHGRDCAARIVEMGEEVTRNPVTPYRVRTVQEGAMDPRVHGAPPPCAGEAVGAGA
jgi:hypothetical protein